MPLSAEAFAAGTARRRIRILHLEPAFLQCVDIIQLAAGYIESALRVDNDLNAAAFDHNVAQSWRVLKVHLVLKARTTASHDRDAQYAARTALFGQQAGDLLRSVRRDLDQTLVAEPKPRDYRSLICCP